MLLRLFGQFAYGGLDNTFADPFTDDVGALNFWFFKRRPCGCKVNAFFFAILNRFNVTVGKTNYFSFIIFKSLHRPYTQGC